MRGRYLYLITVLAIYITVFMACSKENKSENEPDILSPTGTSLDSGREESNPTKPIGDTEQNDETTVTAPADTAIEGAAADNNILKEETSLFVGKIGNSNIHMKLFYEGNSITGAYYYDKYNTDIDLSGTIDYILKDYPTLTLTERTDQNGSLVGIIKSADYIEGYWKNDEKVLPMYLYREGTDVGIPDKPGAAAMLFDGYWYGKHSDFGDKNNLKIVALFDDLIYYEFDAQKGVLHGSLNGLGIINNNFAASVFEDHIVRMDETSDNITFKFTVNQKDLSLESNQYGFLCDPNIHYDDLYTKEDNTNKRLTAIDVGIVNTEEQDESFHNMTGGAYHIFLENTHSVSYSAMNLDGKQVQAGESIIRGEKGNCYYIISSDYLYAAYVNFSEYDGGVEYYTNDPEYIERMPAPMKEWADVYNMEINYNGSDGPLPFDKEIPGLLQEQMKQLLNDEEITLPKSYTVLDYSSGDLNMDGQDDAVVVIQQGEGNSVGTRCIYVFFQEDGGYHLEFTNRLIIEGCYDGGPFGDPYDDISISDGALHVSDYGGSSSRWSHVYSFELINNRLILNWVLLDGFNTFTINGTLESYNLLDGTKVTKTYDDLLLYSGEIKEAPIIDFKDAYAWCESDFIVEPEYPMPSLGDYDFGAYDYKGEMQYSPDEILDMVKQKYYPQMQKIELPCSKEIIDNYSLVLGYDIPTYYYSDGEHNLSYDEFTDEDGRYKHRVFYDAIDQTNTYDIEFYDIWDDTGTIE